MKSSAEGIIKTIPYRKPHTWDLTKIDEGIIIKHFDSPNQYTMATIDGNNVGPEDEAGLPNDTEGISTGLDSKIAKPRHTTAQRVGAAMGVGLVAGGSIVAPAVGIYQNAQSDDARGADTSSLISSSADDKPDAVKVEPAETDETAPSPEIQAKMAETVDYFAANGIKVTTSLEGENNDIFMIDFSESDVDVRGILAQQGVDPNDPFDEEEEGEDWTDAIGDGAGEAVDWVGDNIPDIPDIPNPFEGVVDGAKDLYNDAKETISDNSTGTLAGGVKTAQKAVELALGLGLLFGIVGVGFKTKGFQYIQRATGRRVYQDDPDLSAKANARKPRVDQALVLLTFITALSGAGMTYDALANGANDVSQAYDDAVKKENERREGSGKYDKDKDEKSLITSDADDDDEEYEDDDSDADEEEDDDSDDDSTPTTPTSGPNIFK